MILLDFAWGDLIWIIVGGAVMLLGLLGLNKLPPGKQATVDHANRQIAAEMTDLLPKLKQDGFFHGANWQLIEQNIGLDHHLTQQKNLENEQTRGAELVCEFKRRILESERKNYWLQFQHGLLGGTATHVLVDAVERALDEEPVISPRLQLYKLWEMPPHLRLLGKIPFLHNLALRGSFDRLALGYDVARGFTHAQDNLLDLVDKLAPSSQEGEAVKREILANKTDTFDRIEQLRQAFPEVIIALETRAASRSLLDRQRKVIEEQLDSGLLDRAEADRMLISVDERLQQLHHSPTTIEVPETESLLDQATWLKSLKPQARRRLISTIEPRIHANGEILLKQGSPEGSMAIIGRGSVEIISEDVQPEKVEDIISTGSVIGVYSILGGVNNKTFRAHGPAEILWFNRSILQQLLLEDRELLRNLNNLYDELDQC